MKVEFRKSFERDLRKIKDAAILQRIQTANQEPRCKQTGYGQPKPAQDNTYAPRSGESTRDWIEEIEAASRLSDLSNLKKLKAEGAYYRIRIGDYRIGLSLNGDVLAFVRVLPWRMS